MERKRKARRPQFRHLTRLDKKEQPVLIDAHQVSHIVENMGLKGTDEDKIVSLIHFSLMPKAFGLKDGHTGEEYETFTHAQALLPLIEDAGNCRHRAVFLSALLEAAGINHNIYSHSHPMVSIELKNETITVDYSAHKEFNAPPLYAAVSVHSNDGFGTHWSVFSDRIIKQNEPEIEKNTSLKDLIKLRFNPHFKEGTDKSLLDKLIRMRVTKKPTLLEKFLRLPGVNRFIPPKTIAKIVSMREKQT